MVIARRREATPARSTSSATASGVTISGAPITDRTVTRLVTMVGATVDIDIFIARNAGSWARLKELTGRARRGISRLDPDELDELVALYQKVSTHLSHAQTTYRDPGLTMRLTKLVSEASGVVYRGRSQPRRAFVDFFVWRFPAAVYQSGRFVLASALLLFVPAIVMGVWVANDEDARDVAWPESVREAYLNEDFESYYSDDTQVNFATGVTVNNIQVALMAFAGGILLCLPTAYVLMSNGMYLGLVAGLFASVGESPKFYGLILPHGLLELSAVVVAGAAGLRMGWTIINPGDRTRGQALAVEARRSVVIALGLVVAFMTAGFIEGFVTGRGLSTWLRVAIGIAAELLFITWIVVQGRAATHRGLTGEMGELDKGWDELAAAREKAWAS
jgi:uncharacterized membrane protein SpoIIM required for sporulation